MQTERPVYEEIEELLGGVRLPRFALVERDVDSPAALTDVRGAVREALEAVEVPTGRGALGSGGRG